MSSKNQVSSLSALKFCYNWALKSPKLILWMLIPVFFSPITQSILPFFTKNIIDIASATPGEILFSKIYLQVILYLFALSFWEFSWRIYGYFVDVNYLPEFRKSIIRHSVSTLLKKNFTFFQNTLSGKITKRVFDLGEGPLELMLLIFNRFPLKLFIVGGSIFILYTTKVEFAIIVAIWCILVGVSSYFILPKIINKSEKFSTQESILNGEVTDIFTNILSVKLFSNLKLEKKSIEKSTGEYSTKEKKMEKSLLLLFSLASLSFIFLQAASLAMLIFLKSKNEISSGDFALVLGVNYNIVDAMWYAMFEVMDFIKFLGKTQQALCDINEENLEESDFFSEKDRKNISNSGDIEFKNIYFSHGKNSRMSFENFCCKINSGEKVGIVGKSGSSKTTFVNLLLRIYEVNSGNIYLNGQDISKNTLNYVRDAITLIPQDPSLFCRSIYENIKYGNEFATKEEIIRAAKNASAHDFIESLENGYHTIVGEKGLKISGGQRQRISIARAFLKNSPILILDEATSALDSINEKEIQKSLWNLMQGKTCIVIAHRLSTLVDMDRILFFSEGKIIENGSHNELLNKKGEYYNLWRRQMNVLRVG